MKLVTKSGASIASAAFALAMTGAVMTAPAVSAGEAKEAKIHCVGVNVCKGHSDCKSASNECKGLNSCKGQGFVGMTKDQCGKIGGKIDS